MISRFSDLELSVGSKTPVSQTLSEDIITSVRTETYKRWAYYHTHCAQTRSPVSCSLEVVKVASGPIEETNTVIITVIMCLGRWMFPYRIIIFSEGVLGFIGLSTEKWSSLNRLYHWQSTPPYYTGGESE